MLGRVSAPAGRPVRLRAGGKGPSRVRAAHATTTPPPTLERL